MNRQPRYTENDPLTITLPTSDIVLNSFATDETDPEMILNDALDYMIDMHNAEALDQIFTEVCLEDICRDLQGQIEQRLTEDFDFSVQTIPFSDSITPDQIAIAF